jgi:hypothetical protein
VPLGPFAPNYKTPRSVQMNFGVQREIRHGMIFSADFVRNVETHTLLGVDVNHVGDVKNFSSANAQAAIAATLNACGVGTIDQAITACAPLDGTNPNTGQPNGATMADFSTYGLSSASDFGGDCARNAIDPLTGNPIGRPCAFTGINPVQGTATFLQPIGRSVYNALQLKLVQNVTAPMRGVRALNFQVAYSLSRFDNSGGAQVTGTTGDNDQDFVIATPDNNLPNRYFGPSLLDRTHQISFGGYADLPFKFRLGMIGHFWSPLSTSLVVPNTGLGAGEIFRTDFTGDGTVEDPMPGTHFGQFDRGTNASNLNNLINNYNTTFGNQPTPAGQVLVANNLMSVSQLQALGGVAPIIPTAGADQANFPWLRAFDMNIAWKYTFKERVSIEPSINFFNLFNFGNFDLPGTNLMAPYLTGTPGSINGTSRQQNKDSFRVGNGTGVYGLGAARQIEWGMKLTF